MHIYSVSCVTDTPRLCGMGEIRGINTIWRYHYSLDMAVDTVQTRGHPMSYEPVWMSW